MREKIIVETRKPFKFEPFCTRCGKKTKRRLYFDRASGLSLMVGFLVGYAASLILRFDKNRPWVPYCFRCSWKFAFPSREGIFHIVFAVIFICLGVYLLVIEKVIMGVLVFVGAFIALYIASRLSRNKRADAKPFYVKTQRDKIIYTFVSGHFYDKQMQALEHEETMEDIS